MVNRPQVNEAVFGNEADFEGIKYCLTNRLIVPAMSVLEIPLVRWAIGLTSGGTVAAIGLLLFDGTEQLAVFIVAAVALVGEPLVLKKAIEQQ